MHVAIGRTSESGKVVYDVYTFLNDSYTIAIGYLYDNQDVFKIAIGNGVLITWPELASMTLRQPKKLKVGNLFT